MVRLALCCALSDRVNVDRLRIVDTWPFEVPKTKDAVKILKSLALEGRVLVVLSPDDAVAERSFGNLPHVHLIEAAQLSAYEVLANDWIVFTSATVPGGVTVVEGSTREAVDHSADVGDDSSGTGAASGDETVAGDDSSAASGTSATGSVADHASEAHDDDDDTTGDGVSTEESPAEARASEVMDEPAEDAESAEVETDESDTESSDEAEAEVSPPAASTVDDVTELEDDELEDEEEEDA
jgi:hypothetical protein